MDQKLVAWGRAVKARRRGGAPPLWLFTDAGRMRNVLDVVEALPAGLCGVVFRHDGAAGRAALLRRVAQVCRARRLALVVAGDGRGAPAGTGRHLRDGRGKPRASALVSSSAHDQRSVLRARRAGASVIFVSPVFATESHPDAAALGVLRWAALARGARGVAFALGGVTGQTARRLPRWVGGAGGIGAFLP